jgi:hypothetical protein
LIILWRYGPVLGTLGGDLVHCCVLQFAYCAVVVAEDFDTMEVCCETVVTCVEPEMCNNDSCKGGFSALLYSQNEP